MGGTEQRLLRLLEAAPDLGALGLRENQVPTCQGSNDGGDGDPKEVEAEVARGERCGRCGQAIGEGGRYGHGGAGQESGAQGMFEQRLFFDASLSCSPGPEDQPAENNGGNEGAHGHANDGSHPEREANAQDDVERGLGQALPHERALMERYEGRPFTVVGFNMDDPDEFDGDF